ncbi:hypothetical protein [Escherichia coli]|uniref:hypothetical protein n=1 Tax=Escherichia coli TaxID=562 RepID=UPI00215AC658|nr:hypothetical protein [Escherichia coli]
MKKITVSRQRVDCLSGSIDVGKTIRNQQMVARIDKLSFVSVLDGEDVSSMNTDLCNLKSSGTYQVKVYPSSGKGCGEYYGATVEIRLKTKPARHPILLLINFKPTSKARGPFRMELSPQHYTADELTALFIWLGRPRNLGERLYQLLKRAWVTMLHYALDIYGMRLTDYYIGLKYTRKGEIYDPDNGMEGMRLGYANMYAAFYDKVEIDNKTMRRLMRKAKDETTSLHLKPGEYRQFLRLELRFGPGKEKLFLRSIRDMINLTERLAFYRPSLRDDKALDANFAKLLDQMTISEARRCFLPETKASFRSNKTNEAIRKSALSKIDRVMKKHQVSLFDSEDVWSELGTVLDSLGILAHPQYWEARHRNAWQKKLRRSSEQ